MAGKGGLPPIPEPHAVASVRLPDTLVDPRLTPSQRAPLWLTRKLHLGLEWWDEYLPVARWYSLLLFGLPWLVCVVGVFAVKSLWVLLPWLGAIGLLPFVLVTGTAQLVRARMARARRSGRLVVPMRDLEPDERHLLRTVIGAVDEVGASRVRRQSLLPGGFALLQDEQWRVATALVRLSEARRLHENLGGRLDEHRRALRRTEQAVVTRVRMILDYAASVQRLDLALADVDAATHSHTLDDRLRETLAALGDEQHLSTLTTESQDARTAVETALEVLRGQTAMLRSEEEEPSES